jgi:hypothetical protein
MATCPECFTKKPFWSRRCHSCNEFIGFWRQLFAQWVILVTTIGGMWMIYAAFAGGFLQALLWTLVFLLVPFAIAWVVMIIWFSLFGVPEENNT